MVRGLNRRCLGCNSVISTGSRCARCEVPHGVKYGQAHRRYREGLLVALRESEGRQSCPLCGLALGTDESRINLHHETAIVDGGLLGSRVLVHADCDASHGGKTGTTYRPGR